MAEERLFRILDEVPITDRSVPDKPVASVYVTFQILRDGSLDALIVPKAVYSPEERDKRITEQIKRLRGG